MLEQLSSWSFSGGGKSVAIFLEVRHKSHSIAAIFGEKISALYSHPGTRV